MPETRQPLTGDAARKALAALIEMRRRAEFSTEFAAARLLATGQLAVYAPEEPACVAAITASLQATYRGTPSPSSYGFVSAPEYARALHAADLCSCRADALLRRWNTAYAGVSVQEGTPASDTRAYLAERDR